ncbi:MAG: J domain-containing protein [Cyanobacteria bacterium SBLK]|nr:J domain-containing protein [Cyanobacteria bacterium SBLK]
MAKQDKPIVLNEFIAAEIGRVSDRYGVEAEVLESFAVFVVENYRKKPPKRPKVKPLTMKALKAAVYEYFDVRSTTELRRSGRFQLATNDLEKFNLGHKKTWEMFYRKYVGILPDERDERGPDCINGLNIFKYFRPWDVFGLDPQVASDEEVKGAYRRLAKIYHPDVPETGDARIFDRLTVMYESLMVKV